jgi:hypothetical protein
MTLAIAIPEDYGAVGNGTTDDTTALQDWLDDAMTTTSANAGNVLALKPGSIYKFSSMLSLIPTGSAGRCSIDFTGGQLKYTGSAGTAQAPISFLRVGDYANAKKVFYLRMIGLNLIAPTAKDYATALYLENANFVQLVNCNISGAKSCALKAGASGAGLINGLTIEDSLFTGAVDGYGVDVYGNVVTIRGGKVQQNRDGIRATSSTLAIDTVDLSLNTGDAIILEDCTAARVFSYFESSGPDTKDNAAALIRANGCRGLEIRGHLNCANGATNDATHVAYGVHLTDCHDVDIRATGGYAQRAFVCADADCTRVRAELSTETGSCARHQGPIAGPVAHDDAGHLLTVPGEGTNLVASDVSSWRIGSSYNGGIGGGSDSSEPSANVIRFPTVLSSAIDHAPVSVPGTCSRLVLRFRARLTGFLESTVTARATNYPRVRTLAYMTGHNVNLEHRVTPQWAWHEHVIGGGADVEGKACTIAIQVRNDAIDVEFSDIQLVAEA